MHRSHVITLLLATGLAGALGLSGVAFAAPVPPVSPSAWPTLAEQLTAAGVGHDGDSALARLIADNQDFGLLRPEEAKDRLRLPPWLRVWWRRAHPEDSFLASDPTGGYPLVLKEIHEWMVSHPDLRPGEGTPEAEAEEESAESLVAVSGEQRISNPIDRHSESDIRVNYWNPAKIVAASNNITGTGYQAQYWSADGGSTWGRTTLPPVLDGGFLDDFHSDPTVDWTSDGTAWSSTLGIFGGSLKVRVYKSADGGATWTFDATASGGQNRTDKQMMWVDHSATSPFKDNIYLIWHNNLPVYMNRRTPGAGGSWGAPIKVSGAETPGTGIGADVKTNAQGDVFGFWPDTDSQFIYRVKSTDGGASYSPPLAIGQTFGSYIIAVPAFASRQALIYVTAGAYRTASKNLVYAVWNDLAGGALCDEPLEEPGTDVTSPCKTRIWFTRSTDGGATWAPAKKINDPASLNDQFNPWMVVDEATGALGVVYYDTVADPGRRKTDLWYQSSFDDGVTWSAPVKVTSAPTDETVGGSDGGNQYGDYNGLSGIAGLFFPAWTDRRDGNNEEIWTAAVQDHDCTFPGAPAIVSVSVPGGQQNKLQVAWADGAPPGDRYNVYRALGSCAAPGSFVKVGSAVPGFSYTDSPVSGGLTYSYRVTALDPTGFCESQLSNCGNATPTGPCLEPPSFAGLASAASAGTQTCGVELSWASATPLCAGPVTYDVYRSPTPGFTPGPANRIATGVAGTAYLDTSPLTSGTSYEYVVRAVDASNGVADGNTVRHSAVPVGPPATTTLVDTFEGGQSGGGFDLAGWSHAAVVGGTDWAWSTAFSQTPTHSWFSASQAVTAERALVSPSFVAQAGSTLSFRHTFDMERNVLCAPGNCCDGGTLEVTTDDGANWTTVPAAAFTAGGFGADSIYDDNPLSGKPAWCGGTLGAMTTVNVNLAGWAGSDLKLRWRAGEDSSIAHPGWYVDSVTLTNVGKRAACISTSAVATRFFTVPPCRLVDTRQPAQAPALAPLAERTFPLAGACGVPVGAKALSANVTVTQPTAPGYLNLYPADQPAPATSTINFAAGATRSNNAILAVDPSGAIKVKSGANGTVHLIVDVNGYFQ